MERKKEKLVFFCCFSQYCCQNTWTIGFTNLLLLPVYLRGLAAGKSRLSDFKASILVDLTLLDDDDVCGCTRCELACVELVVFSVAKIRGKWKEKEKIFDLTSLFFNSFFTTLSFMLLKDFEWILTLFWKVAWIGKQEIPDYISWIHSKSS